MDIQYLLFLQNLREASAGCFNSLFSYITQLGEYQYLLLIMAFMAWCVNKKAGMYMGMSYGIGSMINQFFKITFCVYRPWIRSSQIEPVAGSKTTATGYSFPSGHSAGAASGYGALALFYKNKRFIRNFLLILIPLVMFSRNFLGVHTPQDVLVGCLIGIMTAFVLKVVIDNAEYNSKTKTIFLISILLLALGLIIYAMTKVYPIDYVNGNLLVDPQRMIVDVYGDSGFAIGAVLGWYIEQKMINYTIEGDFYTKIKRFLTGASFVLVWRFAVTEILKVLLGNFAGVLIGNIFLMIFIFDLYPLFFTKIEKNSKDQLKNRNQK